MEHLGFPEQALEVSNASGRKGRTHGIETDRKAAPESGRNCSAQHRQDAIMQMPLQLAEAALADEWVINGDRVDLQRRVLRLGKPPRRWKRPPWAAALTREPAEVRIRTRAI